MAKDNTLIYIAVIVGVLLVATGTINLGGIFGGEEAGPVPPSDMDTSVSLRFLDEKATTTTNVDAEWYVFSEDGTFFNSGTAESGSDSYNGNTGEQYTLYAYKSGVGGTGYLNKKVTVNTDAKSSVAKTVHLIKRSSITNKNGVDPVDLNANISGVSGSTESITLQYQAGTSNAGIGKPLIIVEANKTSVDDVTIGSDTDGGSYTELGNCPGRLAVTETNNELYCFERNADVLSEDGLVQAEASVKFADDVTPADNDSVDYYIADKVMYLKSNYADTSDVLFGYEDDSESDLGASDSGSDSIFFSG